MIALVAIIIAPTLFWVGYHYYKDRYHPEPIGSVLLVYGLGIASGFCGLHAYQALDLVGLRYDAYLLAEDNPLGLLFYSVFVIGVVEETVKFIPFYLVATRLEQFDEPIDGIIYASLLALGFATYENIHYLEYLEGREAVFRAVASPLVHAMFASIWGYACGRARMGRRPLLPAAATGLAIACVLHGLYDFAAIGISKGVQIVPPVVILSIWIWRMKLIHRLHQPYGKK